MSRFTIRSRIKSRSVPIQAQCLPSTSDLKNSKKSTLHEFSIDNDNITDSVTSVKKSGKEYNPDYGDYTEDPWKGEESRTGAELAPYARHELLRQFYLDHPEEGYLKGYQPTEWGLLERERDRILRMSEKEAAR